MKAMIFAAGYGSRLGSLTRETPKCLMQAGEKTILQHVLDRLKRAGITEVAINLFYLGDKIESYLSENNNFGFDVTYFREPQLLGTGGGLQNAAPFFEKESAFVVHNSDIYSDIDLSAVIKVHNQEQAIASLCVMDRLTSRPLLFDRNGQLAGWENTESGHGETFGEKIDLQPLAFSGVQVLSSRIFRYMKDEPPFSTIRTFLAAARHGERIQAVRVDNSYWIDMGTPEKLEELQSLLSPQGELQ
jgi:N-acetyl-alpha-D-muramate 1-phosphate uridylyltransferase